MILRIASQDDLDSVVDIALRAMPDDPQWPYRKEHPEDHLKYTKMLFQYFIDLSFDAWNVQVVEAPSNEDPNVNRVVAFSVWDISYVNKAKHGPSYEPQSRSSMVKVAKAGGTARKDACPARVKAFRQAGIEGKQKYFDDIYGAEQIHLQILGTHPAYRRRGFGSTLTRWGMSTAKKDGVVLSLMASPMGVSLYTHLGFKEIGTVTVQVSGEEEMIELHAMNQDTGKEGKQAII